MRFLVESSKEYAFLIAFNKADDFGVREITIEKEPSESYDEYLNRTIESAKEIMRKSPKYVSVDIYELYFGKDGFYTNDYFITHIERE